MMAEFAELQDRIRRLRTRVESVDMARPTAPPPLRTRTTIALPDEREIEVSRSAPLSPSERPAKPARKPAGDPETTHRFQALLEQVAKLIEHRYFETAGAASGKGELAGALNLVSAGLEVMRSDAFLDHEVIRAGLAEILRNVDDRLQTVLERVQRFELRQSQHAAVRAIHQELLGGAPLNVVECKHLADKVLQQVEREGYPCLEFCMSTPGAWVAEHALNTANILAFLVLTRECAFDVESLLVAALIHDAGLLRLPSELLGKDGPLSLEQRRQMEQHPVWVGEILEQAPGLETGIGRAAAQHHERIDGSGYPARATGSQIEASARLLSVADFYAGLRGCRPYRTPRTAKQAMMTVLAEADAGRLDVAVCRSLLRLSFYSVGSTVELATGEQAEVVAPQTAIDDVVLAALPIVRVLTDREGRPLRQPLYWNLAQREQSYIVAESARSLNSSSS